MTGAWGAVASFCLGALMFGAIFILCFIFIKDPEYTYRQACDGSGKCDVWFEARGEWQLCRRDVPQGISPNRVECLSRLGQAMEDR